VLTEGQSFAHYVIEAPIGEGGMGAVYRALDTKLRRKVALKVIHPDLAVPDAAARLVREARTAAAFSHPNTVAIHDLGEIDGTVFLVMELISGAPLRAYVGDSSVPVAQKLRWLVDMARGLGAAHKAGLVHRDVKPTNVMVSDDGVVKVLDFGLAKPLEAASFDTNVPIVVGTPRYMAPELFTGMRADARSDQYAFGVTAYELLSGAYPGNATGPVPAALDTLVPEVSAAVARVVARTLSRSADARFATMNDVATALEEEIFTTRVSAAREAAPSTRREGAPSPAEAALALAPTELPPSSARESAVATPAPRRGKGGLALALVVAVGLGTVAASRFLGDAVEPVQPVADASQANDSGASSREPLDADPTAPLVVDQAVDPPDGASDAGAEGDARDAGDASLEAAAESGSAEPAPHRLPLDEFSDPWAKPPANPAR
jgi:eukaryotic-like serine/threonine-protein kinase